MKNNIYVTIGRFGVQQFRIHTKGIEREFNLDPKTGKYIAHYDGYPLNEVCPYCGELDPHYLDGFCHKCYTNLNTYPPHPFPQFSIEEMIVEIKKYPADKVDFRLINFVSFMSLADSSCL